MVQQPEAVARPRRWPRRLLIGTNVFLALCLIAVGSVYGYYKFEFARIHRVHFGGALAPEAAGNVMNVLVVGSDSRAGISKAEQRQFGNDTAVGGERSDTIIILRVDPRAKKAAILSVPRDLAVHIAGTNETFRINSAFEKGPPQLIATIKENLGIEINHYVEVDFNSFRNIVNSVGDIPVYFPAPARDTFTGLDIRKPGCIPLDGNGSLKYVRSRHYEFYESGRWRSDPTGDIGRIQRQQDFIRRLLRKTVSSVKSNPTRIFSLVNTGTKYVKIDSQMSSKDITSLAKRFQSLEPDAVDMLTLPTEDFALRGAALLKLKQPDAGRVIDQFLGRVSQPADDAAGPLPNVLPNSIRVRVLNGTGQSGQALEVTQALTAAHFNVAGSGDADSFKYIKSVISYGQGQLPKAQLLQPYVGGGAQLKEDLTLRGVDLVLTTGADFSGIRQAPGTAPSTTTTTAPPAKTTLPPSKGAAANQPQC